MGGRSSLVLRIAIVAGAAMRLAMVVLPPVVTPDSVRRYQAAATSIAAGRGLSGSLDQPVYPLLLAAVGAVAGESRRAVVVVQLVLEAAILLCVARLARLANLSSRGRTATIAVALLCPVLPVLARAIWSETLATTVLAATCVAALEAARAGRRRLWLAAGLGGAVCVLTRPDLLPAAVLVLFAATAAGRRRGGLLVPLLATALGAAPPLAAWMAYNLGAHGAARPLGGYAAQLATPYQRWLGTWTDDLEDMAPYWWYVGEPGYPATYPADKVVDPDERARANALLAGGPALLRTVAAARELDALTAKARDERPLRTLAAVPLRRLAGVWLNVTSYIHRQPYRLAAQAGWIAFLAAVVAGIGVATRRRSSATPVLLAVIAGRSVLPLFIGIACEPRYVAEALPACFVLTGFTLDALLGRRAAGVA